MFISFNNYRGKKKHCLSSTRVYELKISKLSRHTISLINIKERRRFFFFFFDKWSHYTSSVLMLLDIVARTDSSEGGGVECSKDEFFSTYVLILFAWQCVSHRTMVSICVCDGSRERNFIKVVVRTFFQLKKIISLLRNSWFPA